MKRSFFLKFVAVFLCFIQLFLNFIPVSAQINISAPSAILMEASTGQIIFEKNADEKRSPASITKIMTLLLTFEQLDAGKISMQDEVLTSAYAASMGGSQVWMEEGETQSLETMIKCIVVSSANDASVAVAEYIAGSEQAFVDLMNEKAKKLEMVNTHFEDCCGLTESENHFTTARDIAIMSRELITKYPDIFNYTKIWMEDITHQTNKGTTQFTLSSTNKLLKQYEWTTGLKTGFTSKAKFCMSATAEKDGVSLISVVMSAPDSKSRFQDAAALLNYGFSVSKIYIDENKDILKPLQLKGSIEKEVPIGYQQKFRYLDVGGNNTNDIKKVLSIPEYVNAPVKKGDVAGEAIYKLNGIKIGCVPIIYLEDIEKATYKDYLEKAFSYFLL